MLAQGDRPRVLHWYQAGPMLFGDWGTSRLYVLGLAFFYTGRASLWFMLAMSCLLVAVGWAYEVICRHFPDGGGVYSAARHRSQWLAVVGGLLLCADYVVTAALSALEAFHYLGVPHAEWWAAAGILAVGIINYFGPSKAATFALVVALGTVLMTLIVGLASVPHLAQTRVEAPHESPWIWWSQFTSIILAISGVEAVANMTGIMVKPVERTASRAIWPVLIEIVVLNLVLTLAMQAIPLEVLGDGDPARAQTQHRDDMLRLMATYYVGPTFAAVASLVFAALLMSAVNTAVTDLVSVQFMMSRDRELPRLFSGLNDWGMPAVALLVGTGIPVVTVLLAPDVGHLAELYAIGVVGAIAINLGTCATNFELPLRRLERAGMGALAVLMILIWLTIAVEKPRALVFALGIVGLGLGARYGTKYWNSRAATIPPVPLPGPAHALPHGELATPSRKRYMVATRYNPKLLEFALEQAQARQAELLVLFVRYMAIPALGPAALLKAEEDQEAQMLFQQAKASAERFGVTVRPIYAVSYDVADTILDIAATHGVDGLFLGATQRGTLWRVMKGDVIQQVAKYLPDEVPLIIHACRIWWIIASTTVAFGR